jgi:hypothetical protein
MFPYLLKFDLLCSGKILHIDFGDCFEASMNREKFPEKVPGFGCCEGTYKFTFTIFELVFNVFFFVADIPYLTYKIDLYLVLS